MHNSNLGEYVSYIDHTNSSLISGSSADSSSPDCLMRQIENIEVHVTAESGLIQDQTSGDALVCTGQTHPFRPI